MILAEPKEVCISIVRMDVITMHAKKTAISQFKQIPLQIFTVIKQPLTDIYIKETQIPAVITMSGFSMELALHTAKKLPTNRKATPVISTKPQAICIREAHTISGPQLKTVQEIQFTART
jgi:hypothetical protein